MANALTLRFGSEVDSAKAGVVSLATSIASNMATVGGAALTAGRGVTSFAQGTISTFQNINNAMGLIRPTLGAVALGTVTVIAAFKAMNAITELAKERLEEYTKIGDQAAKGGVTPEFFQRNAKAADAFKVSVDDVAASLAKLRTDTADKLGGSDFSQRLDKLREAGNFASNTGVGQFESANSDEERYRAIVSLITQAADQGERLAALDLASRFLPPSLMEQLRANSGYLKDMLDSADKLSATQIISNEDIARAIDLKARLEEAQKILGERFKPIQNDLVQLGMNYHENWVQIVEQLAAAVKWATSLYDQLKQIPSVFAEWGSSPVWDKITAATGALGLNSRPEGLVFRGEPGFDSDTDAASPAGRALAAGLRNPASVRQAMQQTTEVAYGARKDESVNPATVAAPTKEDLDAIERFINQMQRANDVLQVELDTAGKSNLEREKGVALAKAQAAARLEGRDLTDDERNKVLELASAHATLASRLKDVQQAQREAAESARYFGNLTSSALGDILVDGKNANDVIDSLTKTLLKAAIQAAITGQGPLASILGLAAPASAGPNAVGGLFGAFAGLFRAGGGDVKAGQAVTVGELGREVFIPDQDGKVYPIGRNSGAQGIVVDARSYPIFQAGMTPTDMAQIQTMLAINSEQTKNMTISAIRSGVSSDSRFIGG